MSELRLLLNRVMQPTGLVLNRTSVLGDDQLLFQVGYVLHQEMVIALEIPQAIEKFTQQ